MKATARPPIYPDEIPSFCAADPSLWQLEFVTLNCREDERRQYCQILDRPQFSAIECARGLAICASSGVALVLTDPATRLPYCVGGYTRTAVHGIYESWMVGTEDGWSKRGRQITKASAFLIRQIFQSDASARRLETMCCVDRPHAMAWYERHLGLVREGTREGYCADGTDVANYALTRAQFNRYEEARYGGR